MKVAGARLLVVGAVRREVEGQCAAEAVHAADHEEAGAGDLHAGSPRCSYGSAAILTGARSGAAMQRLLSAAVANIYERRECGPVRPAPLPTRA